MDIRRISIIATVAIIVIILGGFGFWYLYIQHQQNTLNTTNAGRGLGDALNAAFPVGSAYSNIVNTIGGIVGNTATTTSTGPQLWQASAAPVAGISWIAGTSTPLLRFVDVASGNIFDANPMGQAAVRMSNTLKAQTYRAYPFDVNNVLLQSVDNLGVETFSGSLVAATTSAPRITSSGPGSVVGTTLPRGIVAIAARADSDSIFYIAPYLGGVAGYLTDHTGSNPKRIWTSSLTEWHVAWVGNSIILSTPASAGVAGAAYQLSTTGAITPLLGNIPGLMVLVNTHGDILYSSDGANSSPTLSLQKVGGTTSTLPFSTFAQKCVWANSTMVYCAVPRTFGGATNLPDSWYRGEVHFSDSLWQYNTATGAATLLFDPSHGNKNLDILNLTVSTDGAYLGFTDATTGSGWTLRIQQ